MAYARFSRPGMLFRTAASIGVAAAVLTGLTGDPAAASATTEREPARSSASSPSPVQARSVDDHGRNLEKKRMAVLGSVSLQCPLSDPWSATRATSAGGMTQSFADEYALQQRIDEALDAASQDLSVTKGA